MSLVNYQENLPFDVSSETKSNHIIEVPTQQSGEIYKPISEHPYSPFAWGVSISLVIATTGGVIKIWKSNPEELKYLGECISTVIHAVADFVQVVKSQNKEDHQEENKGNQDKDNK